MIRRILLAGAVLAAPLMFADTTQAGPIIYTIGSNSAIGLGGGTILGQIDVATGTYSVIKSPISGSTAFENLAPAADGTFYSWAGGRLYSVDTTGTAVAIGSNQSVANMYGLAYRPSTDTLFGYWWNSDNFGTVNPDTGVWTQNVPRIGFSNISAPSGGRLAVLNDVLYATGNSRLKTIAWGTYAQTTVGSLNAAFSDMSLATDGTTLYGVTGTHATGGAALYTVNTTTGTLTKLSDLTGSSLPLYFMGAGMNDAPAVPEPGSLALISLLGCAGGFAHWRRRYTQKRQQVDGSV